MKIDQWLKRITHLHHKSIDLSLERVKTVANRLSLPKFDCPVITVGGTNGKGSCVAFLSFIYQAVGYRVGTYTSPHLLRFNERICIPTAIGFSARHQAASNRSVHIVHEDCEPRRQQRRKFKCEGYINHQPVEDVVLCRAFSEIESKREGTTLTFFEFTTLAAFKILGEAHLDIIILEVGMGGRLDAVNLVDPTIAIVTTVSLDHLDFLGSTREQIGFEKAGIFRRGQPAICGDPNPPQSLIQHAKNIGAVLYCQAKDFNYSGQPHNFWRWQSGTVDLKLPIPTLPLQNASTSLMAVHLLQNKLPVSLEHIKKGIHQAYLPGRYQVIQTHPKCIVDVAHNPEATRYLCLKLLSEPCQGKTYAICGMRKDKATPQTLIEMLPAVDEWHFANLAIPNGASPQSLSDLLAPHPIRYMTHPSPLIALRSLLSRVEPHDRIVVLGSFHTVQAILEEKI